MTVYAWPTSRAFIPSAMTLRPMHPTQRSNDSPLNGDGQTSDMPGAKWAWDIDFAGQSLADRQDLEGFLVGLNGFEHRVTLHDVRNPAPRGTVNTTGVTMSATAAQLATSIVLAGCGASKTILRGDWIGLPTGQLVRAAADATANGSGVMTVEIRHRIRAAVSSGGSVTLIQPTARYRLADPNLSFPRIPGSAAPPFSIQLVEAFA